MIDVSFQKLVQSIGKARFATFGAIVEVLGALNMTGESGGEGRSTHKFAGFLELLRVLTAIEGGGKKDDEGNK